MKATERVLKKILKWAVKGFFFNILDLKIQSKLFYEQWKLRRRNKCALRIKYGHKKTEDYSPRLSI